MRPIAKALTSAAVLGMTLALSACGSVQEASDTVDKVQTGASQLEDAVNNLPTNPAQVRDKLTEQLQTSTLTLDITTCSNTSGGTAHVKDISDWKVGPYITVAEHASEKNGNYTAVKTRGIEWANRTGQGDPKATWQWDCAVPKDHVGWLRLSIVALDPTTGEPTKATKWAYLQVTA